MSTNSSPENNDSQAKPPLALIAGPTASGKSALAVSLAQSLKSRGKSAVIINADSAQVYADLRVLSARPDEEEMQGIPHRLFGAWDGATACSTADWAARAKVEIANAHAAEAVPILVGGTGLYMRTLLEGIAPIPPIDPDIRDAVRALSTHDAYCALEAEDPARARMLHPSDSQRIARALEVVRSTGKTMSQWQNTLSGGIGDQVELHPLILLPDREWLYERCDRRFEMMLNAGAIEEVEALLARDIDPALPVMRAIGVPEIANYLSERWSKDEMIEAGGQATRNYAKRQFTWFRNQPPDDWSRVESQNYDDEALFASLLQH